MSLDPRKYDEAITILGTVAENRAAPVYTEQLAIAAATVLIHSGVLSLKPLELPQNTVLVVQEQ